MQSAGKANRLSDHIDGKQCRESVDLLRNCNLFPILITFAMRSIVMFVLLLFLKKIGSARLGEQLTPYQYEDPSPTIPTHRMKEE